MMSPKKTHRPADKITEFGASRNIATKIPAASLNSSKLRRIAPF